jgi:hypothetical protein
MLLLVLGVMYAALAVLVGASDIQEAQTVVTFSRGFDESELAHRKLSLASMQDMLRDVRQVVVRESGSEAPVSLLELGEDEDNWSTEFVGASPNYPAPVANPYSIDNSALHQPHPCGKCTPGSVDCKGCVDEVIMSAGPLHFHLIRDLQRRSLIRSVKWGTSAVPPWTVDYPVKRRPDEVHMHEVAFPGDAFATRPIVLVTVLPVCDGDANKCDNKWTDVFAASLSHISTGGFVVNIVRLDSLPNNTWGQQIHVAWVAFEPNDVKAMRQDFKTGAQDTHVTLHMGPGT